MAGYLFNLGKGGDVSSLFEHGIYSTFITDPKGHWTIPAEATFADYATMKAGDHVYFFKDRMVYGVGELVQVGPECKYCNFPAASDPLAVSYRDVRDQLLWDGGPDSGSERQRWLCTFRPSPCFFRRAVDIDDLLESNPAAFRMLRANWKVSFIKFNDEEDQAILDAILRANQHLIEQTPPGSAEPAPLEPSTDQVFPWSDATHRTIASRNLTAYRLSAAPILEAAADGDRLKHEMAVEAGLLAQLAGGDTHTLAVFGSWSYLSHQVMASPFKPIDWADKMDLFGQAPLTGHPATTARFLVGEVKKDEAEPDSVDQLMKYVDWARDEYAHGDYSMIRAFLVAYDFPDAVLARARERGLRGFTIGRRPPRTARWEQLRLVRYRYEDGRLNFEILRTPT